MTQSCDSCHSPEGWSFASRAFHKAGHFPLEGRHLSVPCASCHLDGLIKGTPTRCYDCHWIRRQDDPYRTRLGNECEECHRPTSWTAVLWDHGARTGMPLNGAHRSLNCDACHKDRVFTNASFDCYSCHREDYEETDDPNHMRAGFPTTCELCHLPSHTSWEQASFNHAASYPLVGVHATQACSSCHKNNVYAGTPRDCYGCHRTDYGAPAIPITSPPGSRRVARPATAPPTRLLNRLLLTTAPPTPWWAPMPLRPAAPATKTTFTPARRATATAATGPITRAPAIPTTSPPGSRRVVRPATALPTRLLSRPHLTTAPFTPWWASTPRRPAAPATRITSMPGHRATATAATEPLRERPRSQSRRRRVPDDLRQLPPSHRHFLRAGPV